MSRKVSGTSRKTDFRVQRTRDTLGGALVELMHEKPFAAIKVQDVLDRAHVGRSTFYLHYHGKDDLFLSDVEDFFEGMASLPARRRESSNRVAPVREMFAHVADAHRFYSALVASGKIHDVLELGQGYFARAIDQRLAGMPGARAITSAHRTALAQALAGALLSLLSWWIDRGMPSSPAQMDDLYHQMVWSGVNGSAGQTSSTASRSAIRQRM